MISINNIIKEGDVMNVSEKAAYLKGLLEGMNFDANSNEGKVFKAIAELLEDISLSILDLEDDQAFLNDYIEEIDEDLGEAERFIYDIDDECDCCCDDDECDCCDCEDFEEIICPECGEPIYISDDDDFDTVTCPSCQTEIEFEDEAEDDEEE